MKKSHSEARTRFSLLMRCAIAAALVLVSPSLAFSQDAAPAARPQTPQPPFPYRSEDVRFTNLEAGILLAGTLVLPDGEGPFSAAILVTGSGPQDRDETLLGHKPFWVIADYLARRGIATLRYDDRGVAASQGNFASATTFEFAKDAQAALDYLSTRADVDPGRVGIVGHSEGGIVASIVASRSPDLGFAVLLAGSGMKGEDILYLQSAAIERASGMSEEAILQANAVNAQLYAIAQRDEDLETRQAELVALMETYLGARPEDPEDLRLARQAQAKAMTSPLLSPWFVTFLSLDPSLYLREAKAPVLAMIGSKDLQVPPKENLKAIREALSDEGGEMRNPYSSIVEMEGLNHLFQRSSTGHPSEYGFIPETFAPEALKVLGDWISSVPVQ
jgi:hypothetical protein